VGCPCGQPTGSFVLLGLGVSHQSRPLKAVLFDLDDTLLQDQPWVEEAMLLACEPAGSVGVAPAM